MAVYLPLFGCYGAGATWNCCRLGVRSVYTIQPYTSLQCDFIRSRIRRMHVYSAATCHLPSALLQNDRFLLRAISVTRGWNGYGNKNQRRKVDAGEENSPATPAGTRTRDLSITRSPLVRRFQNCRSSVLNAFKN